MNTLRDFDFKNKKVLVRCDFNVPLSEKGEILDDFRIKKTIPTIEYLIRKGAKVILISHLGKPGGKKIKELSLFKVKEKLEEYLKKTVVFSEQIYGREVEIVVDSLKEGEVLLLENLRFEAGEEKNDENFAKELARLGQIYINEAFSACHRNHASVVGIPKYLPSAAGFLLEKEIKILSEMVEKPWRPLIVIIGGAKIESKIGVIKKFLNIADHLLFGGLIANTILAQKGLLFSETIEEAENVQILEEIDLTSPKIHLPVDGVIALKKEKESFLRHAAVGKIRKEEAIFDIGKETIKIFSQIISEGKMIFWSGPLGLYEEEKFSNGTREIANAIIRNHSAFKIAGGGDTVSALNKWFLGEKFDHLSTGGGAMLEFLSGEKLPGLEALK